MGSRGNVEPPCSPVTDQPMSVWGLRKAGGVRLNPPFCALGDEITHYDDDVWNFYHFVTHIIVMSQTPLMHWAPRTKHFLLSQNEAGKSCGRKCTVEPQHVCHMITSEKKKKKPFCFFLTTSCWTVGGEVWPPLRPGASFWHSPSPTSWTSDTVKLSSSDTSVPICCL